MTPCPVCANTTTPKYDRKSNWCIDCVEHELDTQHELDTPYQPPEYIG